MSEHLYIHIPFCLKKCRYCDFYSVEAGVVPRNFTDTLVREIRIRAQAGPENAPVSTVYFGGGTPSLMPLKDLALILGTLHEHYSLAEHAEITLEANPGTVETGYFKGIRSLGINRLSLGIQSFDPERLRFLGRIHSAAQAVAAIEQARNAGFDNIGLDLIFGLPEEPATVWGKEMKTALSFFPAHLSCYMLSLEPGTPLHRLAQSDRFKPMPPEEQVARFCETSDFLEQAGFQHYEISNFARSRQEISRHNSAYWQMVPYDGFGPSAHSFGPSPRKGHSVVRSWNLSDLDLYMRRLNGGQLPVEEAEELSAAQQMAELVMVGLRTRDGIALDRFDALSTVPFARRFAPLINDIQTQELGLMDERHRRFALTLDGWACLDSIVETFVRDIL